MIKLEESINQNIRKTFCALNILFTFILFKYLYRMKRFENTSSIFSLCFTVTISNLINRILTTQHLKRY